MAPEQVAWETPDCQVCAEPTDGTYEIDKDVAKVHEMVEMWPGGPLVEEFGAFVRHEVVGTHIRLGPCMHEQPRPKELVWTKRVKNGA